MIGLRVRYKYKIPHISTLIFFLVALVVLGGTNDTILAQKQIYIVVLYVGYCAFHTKRRKLIKKSEVPLVLAFLMLFILQSIGLTYSIEKSLTLRFLCYFLVYALCVYLFLSEEKYRELIKAIRICSLILAVSIVVSAVMGTSFVRVFSFWLTNQQRVLLDMKYGQYSGLVGDRAFAAMAMFSGICTFLAEAFAERKVKKKTLLQFSLCVIALFLTGKRIAFLMMLGCIAFCFMITGSLRLKRIILRVLLITAAIALLIFFFIPQAQILLTRFLSMMGDTTYNGRTAFWYVAIRMIMQKPLLGWGMGSFVPYNQIYGMGIRQYAHNMYLQLAAENGVVGLLAFLGIFCAFITMTTKMLQRMENSGEDRRSLAVCYFSLMIQIGFLIYGFTGYPYYNLQQGFLYSICCGMTFGATGTHGPKKT